MSHFTASVQIYDCLETVQIVAQVTDWDVPGSAEDKREAFAVTMDSVGQDNIYKWLRDALLYAAESL